MVKRSDSDCLFELTSLDGAAGSSATTTAPGAPGVLVAIVTSSILAFSVFDMARIPALLAVDISSHSLFIQVPNEEDCT